MRLKVDDKHVIKSDKLNFILCKAVWNKKDQAWEDKPLSYHANIEQGLKSFKSFKLLESDAETWRQFQDDLAELNRQIKIIGDQLR